MSSPSAVADPTPTDVPSTSLFAVGTLSAKMKMLTTTAKSRCEQAFGQLRVPAFGEERLAEWRAGYERVKDLYRLQNTMEWRVIKLSFWTAFGATTYGESVRRFAVYTAGKLYTDKPHNHLRGRRLDYALTRFNVQGCKVGLKLGIGVTTIVSLILVPTTFRAHFSLINIPLATMMVFGANTTFRGWGMAGWRACVPATIYAVSCPVLAILCSCAYHRCLPDTFYWQYKMELVAYTSDRGKFKMFRYMPWTRREMEHERELGTWRWTSGVEDGLVHLEEEEEQKKEPDQKAAAAEDGDELDVEEEQAAKLTASLDQRRRAWWRLWP
uniref:Uncharacterized protein n=1 Tax=Globodera rostochiensis TaxID=31243 RepID=A0A914HA87_GLORO